jgi:hypothetical protein
MSRALAHRLTRLEQQARSRDLPTWDAVHAAQERLRTAARASIAAVLNRHDAPGRDETQARADVAIIARWCHASGAHVDWEGARRRLCARLTTLAARYAADPPVLA